MSNFGRPAKARVKRSVMIDKRLDARLTALCEARGITYSEAINIYLWRSALSLATLKEKEEYYEKIDILADYCKQLLDNGLQQPPKGPN